MGDRWGFRHRWWPERVLFGVALCIVALMGWLVVSGVRWVNRQSREADRQAMQEIDVFVPQTASNLQVDEESAFLDPDYWLSFDVPREDAAGVARAFRRGSGGPVRPASGEALTARLEEMNPDWDDVTVSSGAMSQPPNCDQAELLLDESDPRVTMVYAHQATC